MTAPTQPPPPVEPPAPSSGSKPPVGRIVLTVLSLFLLIPAVALTVIGSILLWAHATQRDSEGFFTSDAERFETLTYACLLYTSDAADDLLQV